MHEELRDDLAAYALGALGADEARPITEHLAGCEACRGYVRWLGPAVDLLPASVAQVDPPESLRESLMATVHAEAREADPLSAPAARSAARPTGRRRDWRGLVLRPATALAAVSVLTAGGVTGYALRDTGAERSFVEVRAEGALASDEVLATVEHGAGGDAILHVGRAPGLERGHFYQAWVSRNGAAEPAGTGFRVGADGRHEAALGDSLEGAEAVLVTEEPERNSPRPSEALVMSAELPGS